MVARKGEEEEQTKFWRMEKVSALQHPRPNHQECIEFSNYKTSSILWLKMAFEVFRFLADLTHIEILKILW